MYECDVEIVTSCIAIPAGWRIALTLRGKDYEYGGELSEFGRKLHHGTRGTGGMAHNDADNRPPDVFGGRVTLHAGGGRDACCCPSFRQRTCGTHPERFSIAIGRGFRAHADVRVQELDLDQVQPVTLRKECVGSGAAIR